jgi:hypothetical protein
MKKHLFAFAIASFMIWPLILSAQNAHAEQRRQSNERNLYDENRARVDRQIWHDEHQFRPDYWTDQDYLFIPQNERYRYEPRPTYQSEGTSGFRSDNYTSYYNRGYIAPNQNYYYPNQGYSNYGNSPNRTYYYQNNGQRYQQNP